MLQSIYDMVRDTLFGAETIGSDFMIEDMVMLVTWFIMLGLTYLIYWIFKKMVTLWS